MSWVGSWLGGTSTTTYLIPSNSSQPVESPIDETEPEYMDHVQLAVERLCQYAKAKTQ